MYPGSIPTRGPMVVVVLVFQIIDTCIYYIKYNLLAVNMHGCRLTIYFYDTVIYLYFLFVL